MINIHHRYEDQLFRVFNAKVSKIVTADWVSQALLSPQDEEQSWFRSAYTAAHPDRTATPLNEGDVIELDGEEFFKVVRCDKESYVYQKLAYLGEYDDEGEYVD